MKSIGASHTRHLSDSCMPVAGPQEPICPLTPDPHASYLLSPAISHYGTLDPHMHHFPPTSPIALQADCLLPLNNQLTTSNTFPRFQFPSQVNPTEYTQQGCMSQTASRSGTLTTSASMGMGLGLGLTVPPMISSGTATISSAAAAKMNRIPTGLLDQLEHHVPLQRDGFSTLQFHRRSRGAKQRSESPGRIRNLVHSVQKLFSKTQSIEGSSGKGIVQGADGTKVTRRSKSKDRAKTEGAKRRGRPNLSGFWSSDDALEDDATTQEATGPVAVAYRNPLSMMTLGRAVSDSQAPPRTHIQGYNTIAAHRSLKPSKSSGELKSQTMSSTGGSVGDGTLAKRGSWSTLTLSQARQVLQKGTATVNRTLLKSKSYHQELTSNFLQVPGGDWSGTLGKGTGAGGEIPCRRMRSGSYVKAMGDPEDSDQSDSPPSPKPSPKTAARRQSYLKATQQSLSEQQPPLPPRNCLPSLRELTTNRSLDNLDCLVGQSDAQHWEREGNFGHGSSTLGRNSGINQ
ncbi:disks large-associated protein 4 isoform X4, partial [Tachysurus ichikawai]